MLNSELVVSKVFFLGRFAFMAQPHALVLDMTSLK